MKFLLSIVFLAVAISQAIAQDCTPLRCTLPLKTGDCTDSIAQFYFDNNAKRCKPFTYTGCGGNVNRFRTQQLCENTCLRDCSTTAAPATTTRRTTTTTKATTTRRTTTTTKAPSGPLPARCTLALDAGNCSNAVPRFYFDNASKQCKPFNYTGCGGNVNNFATKAMCESICVA